MVGNYINYFKNLAIAHKDLLHNVLSDTGDVAPTEKHFVRWSVDEVLGSLRTQMGWPALLLELYETETASTTVYDINARTNGAFTILDEADINNTSKQEAAFIRAEQIVYDILKQMWQDHYGVNVQKCSTPFRKLDFNNINITPVGPLYANKFGYRVEFGFELQKSLAINEAPELGVFNF